MDRAQMNTAVLAVGLIVALMVVGLLAAIVLPTGIDALVDDSDQQFNQTVSETVDPTSQFNMTLDSSSAGTSSTYTLATTNNSIQKTINENSNETFSFNEGDVTVNVSDAGGSYSVATASWPSDFGWSGGASSMWAIVDVLIVLATFLFIIGLAFRVKEQVE